MRKLSTGLLIVVCATLLACSAAFANSVNVGMSVNFAAGTSVEVKSSEINSNNTTAPADDTWGTTTTISSGGNASGTINFSNRPLIKNPTFNFYSTGYYYAVDVAPLGGGWGGPVTLSYTPGTPDIADHAIITLAKAVFVTPTQSTDTAFTGKLALDNLPSSVAVASVSGGWLRMFIGLATGDTGEPAGVTPFTGATPAGTYTGTLTISYTGA
ncbi:MAG: hypothetical protein A3K83_02405 [Omnitrophica WOR_2 bacterium RBG_13_44_8b]|nr:MAG: hypothetical protein A3K83_02405 [Omnitrophica WOR_2 bacterium RBG_13_44_8b]